MLDLSQGQLGKHVGELLGREWPRQAVSAAERGKRSFTAAELVAFASALETTVAGLLVPPAGVGEIELPNGATLSRDDFVDAVLPPLSAESTFDEMQRILSRLSKVFGTVREGMDIAATDIELLNEGVLITQNLRRIQDKLPAEQIIQAGETP